MSRIGKQEINIPSGVTVTQSSGVITVVGPKGTLTKPMRDEIVITIEGDKVTLLPKNLDTKFMNSLWGTYASHIKNMIKGVTEPYSKILILEGVGFKSDVKGSNLELALGFSHPVSVPIPETLTVVAVKNNITITGIDKELVGQFTAKVRALKKPEPYKGKGFHYDNEVVRRKQGKKAA